MSPVSWFLLIPLALIFGLLIFYFVQRKRQIEAFRNNPLRITGTVTECNRLRSGGTIYQRVTVCYNADGKEYKHVFLCRPDKYSMDQTVELLCLPDNPKTACKPEDIVRMQPQRELVIVIVMCVTLLAIVALFMLSNEIPILKRILKNAEFPLAIVYSIALYVNERRLLKRGISCTGTIVFAERDHKTVRVIAEYTVNGISYDTRQMQMPVKRCTHEYCVGGQIDVLYKANSPGEGAIAEDVQRKEKTRRIAPILGFTVLLPIWIVLMVIFG